MNNPDGFTRYAARFLRRFVKHATPWARDNIFFAAVMLIAPLLVGYLADRSHQVDWAGAKITLTLYGSLLSIFVLVHLVRTPWKLDQDSQADFSIAQSDCSRLTAEIGRLRREADEKRPLLTLNVLEVLYARSLYPRDVFLKVRLSNQRPGTISTVTDYQLSLWLGSTEFRSLSVRDDLDDFRIAEEPHDPSKDIEYSALGADLASRINHTEPIQFGAPREGWLHFEVPGVPQAIPESYPIDRLELKIFYPPEQNVEVSCLAQYSRKRYVSLPNPRVRFI